MNEIVFPASLKGYKIHMVGIKGTGMAALAEILVAQGAMVTGSDVADQFYTDAILETLHIPVFSPFNKTNVPHKTQLIIYSSAYNVDKNEELQYAAFKKIPLLLYTEALGELSKQSFSCGIAGVHGKTTTTGIVGSIIKQLNFPATVLVGSLVSNFDNRCTFINGNKFLIAETCEYQKHFLSFKPQKILLTSIECDHQDFYPNYESILSAFMQYIDSLPQFGELIYCADNPGAVEAAKMIYTSRPDLVFTGYGENALGDYKVNYKGIQNERSVFSLHGYSGEFKIKTSGKHNVLNSAGAIALSISLLKEEGHEIDFTVLGKIREGLESFSGSKRRSELIGEEGGILIMDDYGHHPTAIKTTLEGLKELYPNKRLVVDFMSHTYSRTEALLQDFATSFSLADELILHKIYSSAREKYTGTVSGYTLYEATKQKHKKVKYFEEILDAKDYLLNTLRPGDLFLTMGAGDNWKLGQTILNSKRGQS